MIEGIEPLYRRIADGIESAIREPWSSAFVEVAYFTEHSRYDGEYTGADGKATGSLEVVDDVRHAFDEARELFRLQGKLPWGRARFDLTSQGSFKMKWIYDDCDDQGFARFDEAKELKRARERRKRLLG